MNKVATLKETNVDLKEKVCSLEEANTLARDKHCQLSWDKADGTKVDGHKAVLKSTRVELATLQTQVNTLEDYNMDGSIANWLQNLEWAGPSTL